MTQLQKAILKTLAYADVFDYPLKKEETWRFLIAKTSRSSQDVAKSLSSHSRISKKKNYYFFKERSYNVVLRKRRERWAQKKLKIASRAAGWLRLVPWVKMVGVTGGLAMRNPQKDDDIDLLIITGKNRLWLTRLLAVFLIELVAQRRRPEDKQFKDKICLNMFLDENHLLLPPKEQDLFTAHEVCQLKLLWDKSDTYQKFIRKNLWVKKYLPNWKP